MFMMDYVSENDQEFWFALDQHLSKEEFSLKVRDRRGYVIRNGVKGIGILRYSLFWDCIPFVNLIHFEEGYRNKGFGKLAMDHWEEEMKKLGYKAVLTSTQVDESSQHFYRKLGYKDAGCLVLGIPGYEQPMEMFMIKAIA